MAESTGSMMLPIHFASFLTIGILFKMPAEHVTDLSWASIP
jgi:hypothetical protein